MSTPARATSVPAGLAVALASAVLATGCGSDTSPVDDGTDAPREVTPAERLADAEVRSVMKNTATVMESSFIDLGSYPAERDDLFSDELLPSDGILVEAFTPEPNRQSYCLRGSSTEGSRTGFEGNGEYWWFASSDRRIRLEPRGECAGSAQFWIVED